MEQVDVLVCVLLLAIIVVSLLSNVLVLVCFLYNPEIRKQVPGLFTLNLTVCNLLLTVSSMPLTLVSVLSNGQPGSDTFCRAAAFLDTFLTSNAMLSLAALSTDRWVAVVFPLRYRSRMRRRDAAVLLGYAWVHSVAFSTAAACLSWLGYHRLYSACTLQEASPNSSLSTSTGLSTSWDHVRIRFAAFTITFHLLTFVLTLVVLCVTYLKVLKVARFHCRRIDVITMQTLVLLVDIHPSVRQRCLEEQRRRRQRATRKISTFIGTFVLCFAPYVITRLLELCPAVHISQHWGVLCKCLAYSKAACDPFVYSLLRNQYRKTCAEIVNRILKRSSMNSSEWQHGNGPNTVMQTLESRGGVKERTP